MTLLLFRIVSWRHMAAAVLALYAPIAASTDSSLKIPSNYEDMQRLTTEEDKDCKTCGVVVAVRTEAGHRSGASANQGQSKYPGGDAGPGEEMATVPLASTSGKVKENRRMPEASQIYVVTVRYDSGAYGRVELLDKPPVRKGDRVKVADGKVVLHSK